MQRTYEVLTGLDYATPKGARRAEPGELVDDLPEKSAKWLIEQGHIRPATKGKEG